MDGPTFDGWVRRLGNRGSRRGLLKGLVASAAAGLLAEVDQAGRRTALAACNSSGRCLSSQRCCNGLCTFTDTSNIHCGYCNNSCPSGERCRGGVCVCEFPYEDICGDRDSDSQPAPAPNSPPGGSGSAGSAPPGFDVMGGLLGIAFGAASGGYVGGTIGTVRGAVLSPGALKVAVVVGAVVIALMSGFSDRLSGWFNALTFLGWIGILVVCYRARHPRPTSALASGAGPAAETAVADNSPPPR